MDSSSAIRVLQGLLADGGQLPPPIPPLNTGGGGGMSPDMDARVAKLEAHMEHVRTDLEKLATVPKDLGVLTERVSHLPTKGWMVASLGTGLAVIAALVTFSESLHKLIQ